MQVVLDFCGVTNPLALASEIMCSILSSQGSEFATHFSPVSLKCCLGGHAQRSR